MRINRTWGTLAAIACVLWCGASAEAQLAKQGTYAGHFGWYAVGKTVELEPGHLFFLGEYSGTFLNDADILDHRDQAQSFDQIAAWGTLPLNLYGALTLERVEAVYVTTNFFQTLGVLPVLGRDFTEAEGHENSVIISYGLWQRQFGGERSVIGRKVNLGTREKQAFTIVGVMPAELNVPQRVDLFTTWAMDRAETPRGGSHNSRTIALLKPNVSVEQA